MPVGAVPFPFGICRICKDRATGVHYGVTTCEGCKGFFKRSITRGDKYKCYFGGSCDLTPKNRNRCKSCRFKKCLDVGMSVEAVRMGRIPKVDKEKALEVFQQGGSNYNNLEIQVEMNGKGTYDFKINPKDEDRKSAQQNRSDDKLEDRPFNQEPVISQSGPSQNLQGKIDCDQLEESQGSFQHNVSFNMSNVDRQFTAAESFPGAVSGFDMFARTHINQHPKNSNNARTLGEKSTLRSETFSAQELLHSDQKNLLDCKQDSNSFLEHYGDRQESCKNFEASFTTCDTQSSKNASCRNLNRWHSYDSTLNNPSVCMFDTPLHGTLSSYQSQDFSFDTNKNSPSLQQQLLPRTREGADMEATLDSTPKQATVSMFDIHSKHQERNKPLPQLFQPDGQQEFRRVEKEFPFPESQSTHSMASVHEDLENTSVHKHQENKCVHKHFQNTSESFFKDFTDNQSSNIDSELGYTHTADGGKSFPKKQKREAECFTSLGEDNWFPKQGGISGEEDNQELENQVELLKQRDDLSPACNQSLKNFSSLGSVVSNEGSNSSQRSGYSPAVIQLLLDQVIEFDKGHKLKEKLKQKFQETETDQTVVMHVLNLINIAEEKAKKGNDWDSKDELRLDELPENKFDSMNRFLNDLCNNIQGSEPPLVKKKRIAETQFYESFENLEVEKSALFHTEEHGPNNRLARSGRNEIFPHSQQDSSNQNEKNIRNMNSQMHSLGVSMDQNFDMPAQNVQVSPSRNPVQSRESAFSQNQHLHSQPVLGSQGTSHTSSQGIRLTGSQGTSLTSSQGIRLTGSQGTSLTNSQGIRRTGSQGTSLTNSQGIRRTGSQGTSLTSSQGTRLTSNQGTRLTSRQGTCCQSSVSSVGLCSQCVQVPVSQSSLERSKIYALQPTEFKQLEEFDNTVTSTNVSEEFPRDVEDFQKTLDCMNLGVKILNRFKPEHREKIRLYKQGQLHLRILTDSDEDCAAIYEKLMKGIPGLNDRILGFCESVPGFSSLPKQDKEKLIKRSYYDMWTLSYAEYFQNGESFWILPSGEIYSAQAMRKILNDEMVDTIMKFADQFNSLKLTDLETALFAAVRLTLSAGVDIEDKTGVDNLHTHLLNTFTFEMERNHPTNHVQLLVTVFRLVPLIETINRIQSEIIANFSINRFKKKVT